MINGSFNLIQLNGKYLFIKRADNGLWDITGGGFDTHEIAYTEVALRETKEEVGIELSRNQISLCAILGQRLKKEVSAEYGGIEKGFLFLHTTILYEKTAEYPITLSDEHIEYRFFDYEEIITHWESFSPGSLWLFFTVLTFNQKKKIQEGMLFERRFWQGKEYLKS